MVLLYIDPGAGSMLIQAVLAGALAIPFIFRSTISRILARVRHRDASSPADGGASNLRPDG